MTSILDRPTLRALDAPAAPAPVDGIDCDTRDRLPSWDDLRSDGIDFAILKATEGTYYVDDGLTGSPTAPSYRSRYLDARASHFVVGAYHYGRTHDNGQAPPTLADAPAYFAAQADYFARVVRRVLPGDLPPSYDFEHGENTNSVPWRGAQWLAPMEAFLDRLETVLGRVPMIYTSAVVWADSVAGDTSFGHFGDYPLWVKEYFLPESSRYGKRLTRTPDLPPPWSEWAIWQYSGDYTPAEHPNLRGVIPKMDVNVSNGGIHSIRGLADLGKPSVFGDATRFAAYTDESGGIVLLADAGTWTSTDVTALQGERAAGDVAGCELASMQYVAYRSRGDDGHLHEAVIGGPTPASIDLTGQGVVPAGDPSYLVIGGDRGVVYWGDDDHVYIQWNRNGSWQPAQDVGIDGASGGPTAFIADGAVHVVGRFGTDGHLFDAWHDGQRWQHTDLTSDAGASAATYAPSSYTAADGGVRVVYRAVRGAVRELDRRGNDVDLSQAAGGAPACAGNPVAFALAGVPHVVYRQPDGILRELVGDGAGGWMHRTLPCSEAAADPGVSVSLVNGQPTATIVFRGRDGGLHAATVTAEAQACEPIAAAATAQSLEGNGATATVVIDAGHGGSAAAGGSSPNNATGPNGLREKDLTLDLGRRVGAALGTRANVVLTRNGDENLSLSDRAHVAQAANASIFLSIHLNGFRDPAVDGSEAWVAKHASDRSRQLARSVLDRVVAVTHVPDRGVRVEDLGVLLPDRHAAATAAALLEVAFLTNPEEAGRLENEAYRQAIAQAIAEGVAAQLGAAPVALAAALATTEQQAALDVVDTFRAETTAGVFTPMRADVADRASALIADPTLVDQASLNVCGPAAFHRVWIPRDPVAFARYVTSLYDSGSGSIGTTVVSPGRDLRGQDYDGTAVPAMRTAGGVCPSAEWVALSSLRDSSNTFLDFEGMPSESVAAMTTPGDIAGWLRATGLYATVVDDGNWISTRDVAHAEALRPGPSTDVIMLINAHILTSAAVTGQLKSDEFVLSAFPNHFVVLTSVVTEPTPDEVEFDCWTWGRPVHVRLSKQVFNANYYGAVSATAGTPAASSLAVPPPTRIDGVHPSHHNPKTPLPATFRQDGIQFAIHKASEAKDWVDPDYAQRYRDARAANFFVGAFHYMTTHEPGQGVPALADAPAYLVQQADNLVAQVQRIVPGDLPPTLDFERDAHGAADAPWRQRDWFAPLAAFLDRVEVALGVVPMIYTSRGVWHEFIEDAAGNNDVSFASFADYPLWVVDLPFAQADQYANRLTGAPRLPSAWRDWAIWQYTMNFCPPEFTSLAPLEPQMDMDVSNGGIHMLRGLTGLGRPAPSISFQGLHHVAEADENGTITQRKIQGVTTSHANVTDDVAQAQGVAQGPLAAGDVVACSDGNDVFLAFRNRADGHLLEWDGLTLTDLSAAVVNAGSGTDPDYLLPASDPTWIVTGINNERSLVYRGKSDHLYLLTNTDNTWQLPALDVTANAQLEPASGDAAIYSTGGVVHVVSRAGADGHLWDAWREGTDWHKRDLTGDSGSPPATYRPTRYDGGDGDTRVVYRALRGEIHQVDAVTARDDNLSQLAGGAPACAGSPVAFVLAGRSHVVYRRPNGLLHEIFEDETGWHAQDLGPTFTFASVTDPALSVGQDNAGLPAAFVPFRDVDGAIHEAVRTRAGWSYRFIP